MRKRCEYIIGYVYLNRAHHERYERFGDFLGYFDYKVFAARCQELFSIFVVFYRCFPTSGSPPGRNDEIIDP